MFVCLCHILCLCHVSCVCVMFCVFVQAPEIPLQAEVLTCARCVHTLLTNCNAQY